MEPSLPPALLEAVDARGADPRVLEVLARADERLVELLLPAMPTRPLADREFEDPRIDLVSAEVWLEGSRLVGNARGRGVAQNGIRLDIDLGGGPAADLELGFGRGWIEARALDGGASPATVGMPLPMVDGDGIAFAFELGGRAPRSGTATARLQGAFGTVEDVGPAGLLGAAPRAGVDVLLALAAAGPVTDPDLAVALAVTFGALRGLVADPRLVDADAVAWLRYGQGLDAWLAEAGAEWRLGTLDALGKLTWAWPAAQSVAYGAVPLARERALLDADRYRFVVPDVPTLERLRARAPLSPGANETAHAVDRAINASLRYRAHDALMSTLCAARPSTDAECDGWRDDRYADLGRLGGERVPQWEGVSATWQLDVLGREGVFVGDCATATALTIGTLQALGIPAVGMGWSGTDLATPTHDVPLWYDGAVFRGTQSGPGAKWAKEKAFIYVTLPAVHPLNAWTLGREPNGWSRGGSVVGGWSSYREVTRVLREGLPGEVLGGWIDTQAAGGWPTW